MDKEKACVYKIDASSFYLNDKYYFITRAQVIASAFGPMWQDAQRGNRLHERKVTFGKISFNAVNNFSADSALFVCSTESTISPLVTYSAKRVSKSVWIALIIISMAFVILRGKENLSNSSP